jgi:hypothetical protein
MQRNGQAKAIERLKARVPMDELMTMRHEGTQALMPFTPDLEHNELGIPDAR